MNVRLPEVASSAYRYPLLIKQLLHTPLAATPDQEIVSGEFLRYSYLDLARRVGRLANALASLGAAAGETVAVMDWDSHRYLECYFGIPMMGCVLQTVNVRLSLDQILFSPNDSEAKLLLLHRDFCLLAAS